MLLLHSYVPAEGSVARCRNTGGNGGLSRGERGADVPQASSYEGGRTHGVVVRFDVGARVALIGVTVVGVRNEIS